MAATLERRNLKSSAEEENYWPRVHGSVECLPASGHVRLRRRWGACASDDHSPHALVIYSHCLFLCILVAVKKDGFTRRIRPPYAARCQPSCK